MNKGFYVVISIICLIVFQSCDNRWDFNIPGCRNEDASNYDPNANLDNGSCLYNCKDAIYEEQCFDFGCYWWKNICHETIEPLTIYNIDASSYNDWVYFSFQLQSIVDINDVNADNSMNWDIAFKRNHMKTNGGLSGSGLGCAIVDESQSWSNELFSSASEIPVYNCQVDQIIEGNTFIFQGCYNPNGGHMFEDCIKNPALDRWGEFIDSSYQFIINHFQFFIKDANGNNYAFWPMGYTDTNGETGQISMAYRILD